jgi:hypothetical protein
MSNSPRIWLDYRPVRIGWVVSDRDVAQLTAAARWNSCLWGGRFNPVIPMNDRGLSDKLVRLFGVDVLLPVTPTDNMKAFIDSYPHLHFHMWGNSIFKDRRCEFVDIRHAVKRAVRQASVGPGSILGSIVRPVWSPADPLAPLFDVLLGHYPEVGEITINYPNGIRAFLEMPDKRIVDGEALSPDFLRSVTPLAFTGFDLSQRRDRSGWLSPGIILGSATDFDDLLLLWNLRASGASVCFYDVTQANRLKPFVETFLTTVREHPAEEEKRVNFWSRAADRPPAPLPDFDVTGLRPCVCQGGGNEIWNGANIRPSKPQFSMWHRDVVPSYVENEDGAIASFALPDRPFDADDPHALNQHFVVAVDAEQYGSAEDDLTFTTPFIPRLNEFYGRNFHFEYDKARAEPGSFGRGAVGVISSIGRQRLQIRAIRVHQWIHEFFALFGVTVDRSEPGLRCSRLIRQLGGLHGCRVLKVRGARELIREYGPDQNFTRGAAERRIGNFDESTRQMQFSEFEDLYIQPREYRKLTPGEVLQYMTARGVFRVGLDFKCPNCELRSWLHLDEVKTNSTCSYCGHQFDVTPQLKDRDWRYRRSGLFGRDDNQLGGIPVTLAIQQMDTSLHDSLLMYSTAVEFKSTTSIIEKCEADFVAVVAGAAGIREAPVQILFGEAKTGMEFNADDVRKLGKLAEAVPSDLADAFIMFAKTESFTENELRLAQTLNSQDHLRVILWSVEELEPYDVYERSEERLGQDRYATTLTDMARVTQRLWFGETPSGG